jgi:DNA invertase Pin-like site-specific DNA recombinase
VIGSEMNLVALTRVSTKGQVDRWGLPAQRKAIRQRVKRDGHRIVAWLSDDGITGTLDETGRPGLFEALKMVRDGKADGIIIAEIGRFARELTVQEAVLAKVWALGGIVVTADGGEVQEDDPDDPMRTFIRQVMGAVMQLERGMITKRMRNGRKAKAEAGGYAGYGSPAFGQRAIDGELVTDEQEAGTATMIRELAGQGWSVRKITAHLNDQEIPSKRGGAWHPMTVSRVLQRAQESLRRFSLSELAPSLVSRTGSGGSGLPTRGR